MTKSSSDAKELGVHLGIYYIKINYADYADLPSTAEQ